MIIPLGKSLTPYPAELRFHIKGWQNILLVGSSRSFKSAHAKHITIWVSKYRKCCIFSTKGEWEDHVVNYNRKGLNLYSQKMVETKILKDYCVKLSDFDNTNDFISLGFTQECCNELLELITKGYDYYQDDPDKFSRMLADLPSKQDDVDWYEEKYGVRFDMPIFVQQKQSMVNRFKHIKDWFWFPNDKRPYYNFVEEWYNNRHLIISISNNEAKARSLCGMILRKLRDHHTRTRGFFVFEEMRILAPKVKMQTPEWELPSSLKEIYDMMTLLPKYGCALMGLTQNENMLFHKLKEHWYTRIIGGGAIGEGAAYDLAKKCRWDPHAFGGLGYREVIIWNKDGSYSRYVPEWTECEC